MYKRQADNYDIGLFTLHLNISVQIQVYVACYRLVNIYYIFLCRYKKEFGFVILGRKILVDDVRIRGIGRTDVRVEETIPQASGEPVNEMVGVYLVCVEPTLLSPFHFPVTLRRLQRSRMRTSTCMPTITVNLLEANRVLFQ